MSFAPIKPEQKRRNACYEAGTALAVLKLGTRRKLVRLQLFPICRAPMRAEVVASNTRLAVKKDQLADLYIALAGHAAEDLLCKTDTPLSGADQTTVNAMVMTLCTRYSMPDPMDKVLSDAREVVRKFVEAYQDSITAVADQLFNRGELSSAEIEAIVAATDKPPA